MFKKLQLWSLIVCLVIFDLSNVQLTYAMDWMNQGKIFKTIAFTNHWGRSDIRAYLNRGLGRVTDEGFVVGKNAKINSMSRAKGNGYDRHFSDDEHKIIRETTVQTNDVWNKKFCSCYETTDKFFLPSGNEKKGVISWGNEDISDDSVCDNILKYDADRLIPKEYFASKNCSCSTFSWLRSPISEHSCNSLVSKSGAVVRYSPIHYIKSVSPVFKVSLSSESEIIFSSTVSAKYLKDKESFGRFMIYNNVLGDDSGCWKGVVNIEADGVKSRGCGMFLKKKYNNNNFKAKSVAYNEKEDSLVVSYAGGEVGKAIVVCTETGSKVYCAAGMISTSEDSLLIISSVNDIWSDFNSVKEKIKIKVWMEDVTEKDDLSSATIPDLFSWNNGNFEFVAKLDETYCENLSAYTGNQKTFTLKRDLQCSWGMIDDLSSQTYKNASNQKIYFGRGHNDIPLEFWIAGRENERGVVNRTGGVMCLYQAVPIEECYFNLDFWSVSDGTEKVELILEDEKSSQEYPKDGIKLNLGYLKEKSSILWRHKNYNEGQWISGMPIIKGKYELQAILPETDSHETVYSLPVTFTLSVTRRKINLLRRNGFIQGIKHPVLSSSNSAGWMGSKVYFGSYKNCPLLFRVIDIKIVNREDGNNYCLMKLDCDSVIKKIPCDRNARNWLNQGLFKDGFSNLEWEAFESNSCYGVGDKIFELDLNDVLNEDYGYSDKCVLSRVKRKFGGTALRRWWLSSKKQGEDKCIGLDGSVEYCHSCFNCVGVSPAMNLNLSSVLFISSGNKPSSSKLEAIQIDGTTDVWKFTLIDSSKIIRIQDGCCVEREENIIKVPYIYEGDNINRISVMITDALSEEIFYYGGLKVDSPLENIGIGSFELPNDLPENSKFYVVAEQINKPGFTDYASKPFELYI